MGLDSIAGKGEPCG